MALSPEALGLMISGRRFLSFGNGEGCGGFILHKYL